MVIARAMTEVVVVAFKKNIPPKNSPEIFTTFLLNLTKAL